VGIGVVARIARRWDRLVETVDSRTESIHAEQTQHPASTPYPGDEVQGDELGRFQRGPSTPWQPDLVVTEEVMNGWRAAPWS
jgi:hypothetical protein